MVSRMGVQTIVCVRNNSTGQQNTKRNASIANNLNLMEKAKIVVVPELLWTDQLPRGLLVDLSNLPDWMSRRPS
ncbi:hypothetical protein ScPMuIL_018174 [Solemya velum]